MSRAENELRQRVEEDMACDGAALASYGYLLAESEAALKRSRRWGRNDKHSREDRRKLKKRGEPLT